MISSFLFSYNLKLSNRRNKTVVDYIKKKIEKPERVSGKGYGEISSADKSPCYKLSETEHQKNRRTDFKLKF